MEAFSTDKQIKLAGTTTHRLEDGKIVEAWIDWDVLGIMQQLGAVTLPASK
jgi:predicted ester cyclase